MSLAPAALIFVLIIILFVLFVWLIPVRLWIAAWSSGAKVGFGELIGMRLRRVSPGAVVNPRIAAVKAGLHAETNILESHYLAGGNVERVVNSLISADKAGISLDFSQAAAIDLAGVLRPMFDLAADYFDREMTAGVFKRQDARQLMITGYGALLSYFSDEPFLEGLLDIAPLSDDALAAREEHIVQFFRSALLP